MRLLGDENLTMKNAPVRRFHLDDPPLEVVEACHDRCPIPIQEDDIDVWLDPNPNDLPSLYAILDRRVRPFYEHQLAKPET